VLIGPRSHKGIGRLRASTSAPFAQQPGTPEPPGTPPAAAARPYGAAALRGPTAPDPDTPARSAARCDRRSAAASQRLGIYGRRFAPTHHHIGVPAAPAGTDQPLAPARVTPRLRYLPLDPDPYFGPTRGRGRSGLGLSPQANSRFPLSTLMSVQGTINHELNNKSINSVPARSAGLGQPGRSDGVPCARSHFCALARSTAVLASRSKLSASCNTACLAPGSVNCPATSRDFSARSSQSKASSMCDGIWSSLGFIGIRWLTPESVTHLRHLLVKSVLPTGSRRSYSCRLPDLRSSHPRHVECHQAPDEPAYAEGLERFGRSRRGLAARTSRDGFTARRGAFLVGIAGQRVPSAQVGRSLLPPDRPPQKPRRPPSTEVSSVGTAPFRL
jgi:hypothetical protein